jgi:hypothetical protein
VYTATTTFTQSQCDACDDYLVHVLGMEMSGLGNIAMLGSPFSLEVRPAAIDFTTSYCTGHGCDIAYHGVPSEFEGNPMIFYAMDTYGNSRLVGEDPMLVNFLSASATMEVQTMPDGAYNVTYWWSIAAFDQLILICPNDAAGATDWAIDLSACGVNVQTECPEDHQHDQRRLHRRLRGH